MRVPSAVALAIWMREEALWMEGKRNIVRERWRKNESEKDSVRERGLKEQVEREKERESKRERERERE